MGPIAQAVTSGAFDEIGLLSDHSTRRRESFVAWLREQGRAPIHVHDVKLTSTTHYAEIYQAARSAARDAIERHRGRVELTFHLSPGTPAMTAVWIILGKTQFHARLIESSKDHGVREAQVPFDLAAEFVPALLDRADEALPRRTTAAVPEHAGARTILYRSVEMGRLLERAGRTTVFSSPILIEGESGKELLARFIHDTGPRHKGPFRAINCSAIFQNLTTTDVKRRIVPLPPLVKQEQFAQVVASWQVLRSRQIELSTQTHGLFDSIMQFAFRGA